MIRFHMVNYQIVNGSIAYGFVNIIKELSIEIMLNGINQSDLGAGHNIGIVADAKRKRPKAFKKSLSVVVYTDIKYSFADSLHNC